MPYALINGKQIEVTHWDISLTPKPFHHRWANGERVNWQVPREYSFEGTVRYIAPWFLWRMNCDRDQQVLKLPAPGGE